MSFDVTNEPVLILFIALFWHCEWHTLYLRTHILKYELLKVYCLCYKGDRLSSLNKFSNLGQFCYKYFLKMLREDADIQEFRVPTQKLGAQSHSFPRLIMTHPTSSARTRKLSWPANDVACRWPITLLYVPCVPSACVPEQVKHLRVESGRSKLWICH